MSFGISSIGSRYFYQTVSPSYPKSVSPTLKQDAQEATDLEKLKKQLLQGTPAEKWHAFVTMHDLQPIISEWEKLTGDVFKLFSDQELRTFLASLPFIYTASLKSKSQENSPIYFDFAMEVLGRALGQRLNQIEFKEKSLEKLGVGLILQASLDWTNQNLRRGFATKLSPTIDHFLFSSDDDLTELLLVIRRKLGPVRDPNALERISSILEVSAAQFWEGHKTNLGPTLSEVEFDRRTWDERRDNRYVPDINIRLGLASAQVLATSYALAPDVEPILGYLKHENPLLRMIGIWMTIDFVAYWHVDNKLPGEHPNLATDEEIMKIKTKLENLSYEDPFLYVRQWAYRLTDDDIWSKKSTMALSRASESTIDPASRPDSRPKK